MFDTLLSMPLFQGLGDNDLTRILEKTRLEFMVAEAGTTFVKVDDKCDRLLFIFEGEVEMQTFAANRKWSVVEDVKVPAVVGIDAMFSPSQRFKRNYTAVTKVHYLLMEKNIMYTLVEHFDIFRFNVINLLTSQARMLEQTRWLPAPTSLEGRIIAFMREHVSYPAGRKVFRISQMQLGAYLGKDSRYVGRAVKRMEAQGLLTCHNRCYTIAAFEKLRWVL